VKYSCIVNEFFNPILDPDADPDHHQNLITANLGQDSAKSACNFLCNSTHRPTDK